MQGHRLRHLTQHGNDGRAKARPPRADLSGPQMKASSQKWRQFRGLACTGAALLGLPSSALAQDDTAAPGPNPPAAQVEASATVQTEPVTLSGTAQAPAAPAPPPSFFDVKLAIGLGVRTEFTIDPDREDPEDSPVYTLGYDLRPFISGQVNKYIKFEGNLDSNQDDDIVVQDAIIKFEFNDYANIWTGHFLPPSDRANLSGPYYQNAWNYPTGVHAYPSAFAGRDNGLAFWGQINGGQFKYQVGLFGMDAPAGTPDPRFAARVTYNVFDPESGYYNSSTYYGTKNILAFGAVLQYTPAPDGAPDAEADALWNLDALWENTFGGAGTLDVEGAFYGFGGADQGTSFFLLGSFLLEDKVGIGQFQPMLRLQRAQWNDGDTFPTAQALGAPDGIEGSLTTLDAGIHYIINGHNARLAATLRYNSLSVADADSVNDTVITLGAQIQAF